MSDKKIGKWFEEKIREALVEIQKDQDLFFHRFKDSHAAGKVIGNVPSDFLVSHLGFAELWEAKASEVHASLRQCLSSMVDDGQVGQHLLWQKTGSGSRFLFYSDLTAQVEVWSGDVVVCARLDGKPLPKDPLYSDSIDNLNKLLRVSLGVVL